MTECLQSTCKPRGKLPHTQNANSFRQRNTRTNVFTTPSNGITWFSIQNKPHGSSSCRGRKTSRSPHQFTSHSHTSERTCGISKWGVRIMSQRKKSHNRGGKSRRLSGSTLRLLDRVSNGLGASYMEQQKEARRLTRNQFRGKVVKGG